MILHGEDREPPVPQARNRLIIEVDVRDLDLSRQRCGIDGKSVIVRRDLDAAAREILDRLVTAAMAEFELVGATAECLDRKSVV